MFLFAQERAERRLDKAECRRPIDSLGPTLDRQLQEDALCMRFNSLRSDTQLASDPFVGQPIAHEANDHVFPSREGSACMLHSPKFPCETAPDFFGEHCKALLR